MAFDQTFKVALHNPLNYASPLMLEFPHGYTVDSVATAPDNYAGADVDTPNLFDDESIVATSGCGLYGMSGTANATHVRVKIFDLWSSYSDSQPGWMIVKFGLGSSVPQIIDPVS